MTQEQKDLLLKDLCSKLPYGIKVYDTKGNFDSNCQTLVHINGPMCEAFVVSGFVCRTAPITDLKPYLFPLSSMTEEQKKELKKYTCPDGTGYFKEDRLCCPINHFGEEIPFIFMSKIIEWLDKNYFDYRGLIPMGLAINATNLNIY